MSKKSVLKIEKKKKNYKEFFEILQQKYGITAIEAEFNGGGDSGEIEDITYYSDIECKNPVKDKPENGTDAIIIGLLDEYLDNTGYDWYNDDGGYGSITLNLITGDIKCEMNIAYISYDTHHLRDTDFFKEQIKNPLP